METYVIKYVDARSDATSSVEFDPPGSAHANTASAIAGKYFSTAPPSTRFGATITEATIPPQTAAADQAYERTLSRFRRSRGRQTGSRTVESTMARVDPVVFETKASFAALRFVAIPRRRSAEGCDGSGL
mmetsp:Transcript_19958/g.39975  ORF Transcript_19958/g.39975 Transcript_19958/m.39975 type:complete len:130 (-) Transcript_19958:38-427(-)